MYIMLPLKCSLFSKMSVDGSLYGNMDVSFYNHADSMLFSYLKIRKKESLFFCTARLSILKYTHCFLKIKRKDISNVKKCIYFSFKSNLK